MKKIILIFIVLLFSYSANSQKRGNIWCFGDSCLVNFNTLPPTTGSSIIRTRGTACSIADSSGNLLFYCGTPHVELWQAGGVYFLGVVYNKNNEIMEGGDTLAGEGWYYEMVIVTDPNNNNRYYLFHLEMGATNTGLYYSVIDLSYNSGLGKVISKNNQLISGNMADGVAAVKQGNGRDWWVLARRSDFLTGGPPNNDFNIFSVSPNGIDSLPVQSTGSLNTTNGAAIRFSPSGERFVFTNWRGMIEAYDFDRCTGIISNPVNIEPEVTMNYPLTWSSEFSSSGQYLYVSTSSDTSFLYQYDIYASNISNSRKIINVFSLFPYVGGELKRGPDNKIYFATAWNDGITFNFPYPDTLYNMYNMSIGVINQPDSDYNSCDFQPFSFYLGGKRNYYGLPNNPDYDLGPLVGSPCDTLHLAVKEIPNFDFNFLIYPNPGNGTINFSSAFERGEIRIVDAMGKIIFSEQLFNGKTSVPGLGEGIYLAQLFVNENLLNVQKFIVLK